MDYYAKADANIHANSDKQKYNKILFYRVNA